MAIVQPSTSINSDTRAKKRSGRRRGHNMVLTGVLEGAEWQLRFEQGGIDPRPQWRAVVNLLLELGVAVDLVIHGYCPGERFK